jgi:hypothetical protein
VRFFPGVLTCIDLVHAVDRWDLDPAKMTPVDHPTASGAFVDVTP